MPTTATACRDNGAWGMERSGWVSALGMAVTDDNDDDDVDDDGDKAVEVGIMPAPWRGWLGSNIVQAAS